MCPKTVSPATTATNSSEQKDCKEKQTYQESKTPSLSLTKTAPAPNDQCKYSFIFALDACDGELQHSHELPVQHIHFSHW